MMYTEIITVCSEIHTKHINSLCVQNVELLIVKPGGPYSNHWALRGWAEVKLLLNSKKISELKYLKVSKTHRIEYNVFLNPAINLIRILALEIILSVIRYSP
jgi:hypothetical protein